MAVNSAILEIRPARHQEAEAITKLVLASKAHWGYDDAFMEMARPELTVTPQWLEAVPTWVAEADAELLGMFGLGVDGEKADVEHFFVAPSAIGSGVGRLLWDRLVAEAEKTTASHIMIDADPNAEGFYLAMGARRIGAVPSATVPGRLLPLLRYDFVSARA